MDTEITQGHIAGVKFQTTQRETGTLVTVYDADVQGMDPDAGKYAVICEDHGYLVNVDTLKIAIDAARHPGWNFCDDCQELLNKKEITQ